MVNKICIGIGAGLCVLGVVLGAVISVIREWVIAEVEGIDAFLPASELPCIVGKLGLFTAEYTPGCSAGTPYELPGDSYTSPTTEFAPLFPAQTGFGGSGETFEAFGGFTYSDSNDCATYLNTLEPVVLGVVAGGFASVNLGVAEAYTNISAVLTPALAGGPTLLATEYSTFYQSVFFDAGFGSGAMNATAGIGPALFGGVKTLAGIDGAGLCDQICTACSGTALNLVIDTIGLGASFDFTGLQTFMGSTCIPGTLSVDTCILAYYSNGMQVFGDTTDNVPTSTAGADLCNDFFGTTPCTYEELFGFVDAAVASSLAAFPELNIFAWLQDYFFAPCASTGPTTVLAACVGLNAGAAPTTFPANLDDVYYFCQLLSVLLPLDYATCDFITFAGSIGPVASAAPTVSPTTLEALTLLEQLVDGCVLADGVFPQDFLNTTLCLQVADGTSEIYSGFNTIGILGDPRPHYLCVQQVNLETGPSYPPSAPTLGLTKSQALTSACSVLAYVQYPASPINEAADLLLLCGRAAATIDPSYVSPTFCQANWLEAFLTSFYDVNNTADAIAECQDDNIDADRISTAQILVPIGIVVIGLGGIAGAASLAAENKGMMMGGGLLAIVGGALVAAALALVITAPVYASVGEPADDGDAVYTSGIARPLGLITIVAPIAGGVCMIVGALIGGEGGGILSAKAGAP